MGIYMMGLPLRLHLQRGFTLIEVAMAVVIIGVLLIPLLTLLGTDIINDSNVRDAGVAYELAQEELEWLLYSKVPASVLMKYYIQQSQRGDPNVQAEVRKRKTPDGTKQDVLDVNVKYEIEFAGKSWQIRRHLIMDQTYLTEIHIAVYGPLNQDKPLAQLSTLKYQ